MTAIPIVYVTSSDYKVEENDVFNRVCLMPDGTPVVDVCDLTVRSLSVSETLEVDLRAMVQAECAMAYHQIKVPCIVEHAGLIFDDYASQGYPGGLTKPMWNALGDRFIDETHSAQRPVVARAVVAYCDGYGIETFVGETRGVIADTPRGSRKFYWDTIFVPSDDATDGRTYAEIIDDTAFGLDYKVLRLSQSSKAKLAFLSHLREVGPSRLWRR